MIAAENGRKDTVQLLVEVGADVNKANKKGSTGAWGRRGGDPAPQLTR